MIRKKRNAVHVDRCILDVTGSELHQILYCHSIKDATSRRVSGKLKSPSGYRFQITGLRIRVRIQHGRLRCTGPNKSCYDGATEQQLSECNAYQLFNPASCRWPTAYTVTSYTKSAQLYSADPSTMISTFHFSCHSRKGYRQRGLVDKGLGLAVFIFFSKGWNYITSLFM